MTGKEKVAKALKFEEADLIPYDLAGTTVTTITKNAYVGDIMARGMSTEYEHEEVDPISQIVTPVEVNLLTLRSDTRWIGSMRIPEWCETATVLWPGQNEKIVERGKYLQIERKWKKGDSVNFSLKCLFV